MPAITTAYNGAGDHVVGPDHDPRGRVIDDPAAIGPGMALALLGTMYAIVLGYGVCLPLQAGLKERAGEAGEKGLMTGATLVFLFAFVLSLGLLVLLMYSFSGTQS